MSTKIFYAYRVKKSDVELMEMLWKFSDIATHEIANNEGYLKLLHEAMLLRAVEDQQLYEALEEEYPQYRSKYRMGKEVMEKYLKGEEYLSFQFYLTSIFDTTGPHDRRTITDTIINEVRPEMVVAVGMDDEYYYLKFFPNNIFRRILIKLLDEFPQIEDFHYQNQTDPPEDVPYDEYKERDNKWEELTGPVDNYTRMLTYEIFGMDHLKELITKNWYTGTSNLYEHLAYQFDDYTIVQKKEKK